MANAHQTSAADKIVVVCLCGDRAEEAEILSEKLNTQCLSDKCDDGRLMVVFSEEGVSLEQDGLSMMPDFSHVADRIKGGKLAHEMLVKAAKFKDAVPPLRGIDATAGLGEDGMILAAAGFEMTLYEYNPVIALLLKDALRRAAKNPQLAETVARMKVCEGDSIAAMKELDYKPQIVLLDPMFPKRDKSGLIKKKFQLLQQIESPCSTEQELLTAALSVAGRKVIIKRPLKGPYLGEVKPDYSLTGKAIRYDCHMIFEK